MHLYLTVCDAVITIYSEVHHQNNHAGKACQIQTIEDGVQAFKDVHRAQISLDVGAHHVHWSLNQYR